mmetsp:Transcript_8206/g.11725  ORF Transcript_8206/g.11725 Transcript_8206/m.11725 type:complete len:290 (+) Transcript_8206:118-987(+)|eukprot:CAMPEP_0184860748 /NCGR_PEP_ID=MMETSP0580-20130426/5571_1 /TAXON_ID=1118495 /ORGANISM="Dactyliosolen fragilissimus" /LENGTH=289 /DNA_ID=CAMNT_0027357961 /DNA_START=122 /DNA_END=991 /DNA_ORIENTATION=+
MSKFNKDMKRLEGITFTKDLRSVALKIFDLEKQSQRSDGSQSTRKESVEMTARGVQYALSSMPSDDAEKFLMKAKSIHDAKNVKTETTVIPLACIKAFKTIILENASLKDEEKKELLSDLESALCQSKLHFSIQKKQEEITVERKKYLLRMERLKLRNEERNYSKLTRNLDRKVEDDATMKSMSYAASVGANMIVAPISFGVFMYFFSGAVFGWILGDNDDTQGNRGNNVDIKKVIAGVISGVVMLFIEMILFVIRNHEMDESVRKKKKKAHANPFGYDKKKAERTFHG